MTYIAILLYILIGIGVFWYFQYKDNHTHLSADTAMPWTLEVLIAVLWVPAIIVMALGMGWSALRWGHDKLFGA